MPERYIVSTIRINGDGPRYALLDVTADGGEGEPLIEARFYCKDVAEKAAAALNGPGNFDEFKKYVHARLDAMGVPEDPEPDQTRETGCRIGGRLNWIMRRLA